MKIKTTETSLHTYCAVCAELLQWFLTPSGPMHCSLPDSVHGILQNTRVGCHAFLQASVQTAARQASLSVTNSWSLLKLMSIESVMPSNRLICCCPFSSCLNLSQHQGLLQWFGSLHQVARVLELQLQHQSFQWIFRIEWLYKYPITKSPLLGKRK